MPGVGVGVGLGVGVPDSVCPASADVLEAVPERVGVVRVVGVVGVVPESVGVVGVVGVVPEVVEVVEKMGVFGPFFSMRCRSARGKSASWLSLMEVPRLLASTYSTRRALLRGCMCTP